MAKYLSENEVGFDQTELGFPSIGGCHAIVYATTSGLFGFHNFGGDAVDQWPGRSAAFASFVDNHAGGPGTGGLLYGLCFLTGAQSRGYRQPKKQEWTSELVSFANALRYDGEIWGYDLGDTGLPSPVYVVYHRPVGTTCVIQVKAWNDADSARGQNSSPNDHQMIVKRSVYSLGSTASKVVTSVSPAGLRTVYPEKLRS
jgi:hypothetical protein